MGTRVLKPNPYSVFLHESGRYPTYAGHVPAEADLVCYWFEKAGRQIASGKTARAGLVATNSKYLSPHLNGTARKPS